MSLMSSIERMSFNVPEERILSITESTSSKELRKEKASGVS